MMDRSTATLILWFFNDIVLVYFVVLNSVYLVTSFFAFGALKDYVRRIRALDIEDLIDSSTAPPITLIAPAFNEVASCVESIRSLLTLKYREYEILVVNDGSEDATLPRLIEAFGLTPASRHPTAQLATAPVRGLYHSRVHPSLWVIDKERGGKADALNAGLNYCRTPLFCAMDADSLLERDALLRIVRPFLEDGTTIAAGGIIRIVNGCTVKHGVVTDVRLPRGFLARCQVLEYLRAFLSGRMGWDALQSTLVISGAFGLFRRSTVVDAGGYRLDTVGEDMELVVRLHRHCLERKIPYRITFVPDPVAWTQCPETLHQLARQRDRWQRGLSESLVRHQKMLFNPKYGRIGMLAYPYFYFLEMLGPVVEVGGYICFVLAWMFHLLSWMQTVAFLMVAFFLGVALSVSAVGLEELTFRRYPRFGDLLRMFALSVLENFGYRQLSSWWRVRGMLSWIFRVKRWGKMERKGFGTPVADTPPGI